MKPSNKRILLWKISIKNPSLEWSHKWVNEATNIHFGRFNSQPLLPEVWIFREWNKSGFIWFEKITSVCTLLAAHRLNCLVSDKVLPHKTCTFFFPQLSPTFKFLARWNDKWCDQHVTSTGHLIKNGFLIWQISPVYFDSVLHIPEQTNSTDPSFADPPLESLIPPFSLMPLSKEAIISGATSGPRLRVTSTVDTPFGIHL